MSQTPGQKLKELRESKGISLEEISQKTHIRLNYLEAIESNEVDQILSEVHKRGFLRLYANELGVNLEELQVEDYLINKEIRKESVKDADTDKVESHEPSLDDQSELEVESDIVSEKTPTPKIISIQPGILENKSLEIQKANLTEHATSIFRAIGAKLQARRKLLSLSYDDLANNLHIRKEFLKALEEGQIDVLPSPVQARGMLANYAEFLNLNVDEILLEYADGLQVRRIEKQKKDEVKDRKSSKKLSETRLRLKNFFSMDLLMISALFLVFVFFVVWGMNRILTAEDPNLEATDIPEVADVLLDAGSPTMQLSITVNATQPNEIATESTPEEPTPIFTPLPNNSPINIVIIPRQNTWVQITTDNEINFVGRLIFGNAYDYSGDESIEILTGNAGALQIFYNDQDIGSPGLTGQVVNLIFTESGLVQPTPTNTPTITNTPRPTPSHTPTPTSTQTRMPTATPTESND